MTVLQPDSPEYALCYAVDAALIAMLTAAARDHARARQELDRALTVLEEHPQLPVALRATDAVREAAQFLANGEWAQARTALVVACEKLAHPDDRLGDVRGTAAEPVETATPRRCAWRRTLDDRHP